MISSICLFLLRFSSRAIRSIDFITSSSIRMVIFAILKSYTHFSYNASVLHLTAPTMRAYNECKHVQRGAMMSDSNLNQAVAQTEALLETRAGMQRFEHVSRVDGYDCAMAVTVRIATGLSGKADISAVAEQINRRIDAVDSREVA